MATSKRDTLIVGLRNAYGLEGQALSTMENVHSRLEHYPELKAGVGQHIEETRRQQQMVEQCLSRFGESPSTLKEATMKLMGNLQAMVHATHQRRGAQEPVRALRVRAFRDRLLHVADRDGRGVRRDRGDPDLPRDPPPGGDDRAEAGADAGPGHPDLPAARSRGRELVAVA